MSPHTRSTQPLHPNPSPQPNSNSKDRRRGGQPLRQLLPIVIGVWTLATNPHAVRADDSPSNPAAGTFRQLEARVKNGEVRGWEQIRRVFVKHGTNELVFAVPHGLRVDTAGGDKITLIAQDTTYYLTFCVRVRGTESGLERPRLLRDYADAKITDEYQAATSEHTGRAYELNWTPADLPERLVRIALIPTEAGNIELTLVAEPKKTAEGTFAFNHILATIRKSQDGKFEFVRTTDAS